LYRLTPYRTAIETELANLLISPSPLLGPLYGMMRYHLGWVDNTFRPAKQKTGKRLRPMMCLLVCETTSGQYETALPAAAAIEVLHNFSLIHDDIEDQDKERHNRPTVWAEWGIAQGINTGDAMFVLSHIALHTLLHSDVPPIHQTRKVIQRFDETTLALCQGQYLDISFETRKDVAVEDYLRMIRGKTAALLAYATESGACLGDASAKTIELYHQFGEAVGMAFQMIDDELGIWGNASVTGKPVGADLRQRKKSLPVVYALSSLTGPDSVALRRLYDAGETLSDNDILQMTALLERAGARDFIRNLASEWQERALLALDKAGPAGPSGDLLRDLTTMLLTRTY